MTSYQITHTRPDGSDHDRRIDGFMIDGGYYDIDRVIGFIRNDGHWFYTSVGGVVAWVEVRKHANGVLYLTTQGDGFPPNNLLRLPPC